MLLKSEPNLCVFLVWVIFFLIIYLIKEIRPCHVLVVAHRIFSCGMRDLVPWSRFEPGSPTLGAWSLSYWTTKETPPMCFWNLEMGGSYTFPQNWYMFGLQSTNPRERQTTSRSMSLDEIVWEGAREKGILLFLHLPFFSFIFKCTD